VAAQHRRVDLDALLPVFDVSDEVAVTVAADPATTWRALMDIDLVELGHRRPLVGALGGLRLLPELVSHAVHGEAPPAAPQRLTLKGTAEAEPGGGSWVLLGEEPGRALALGLVGRFWRPVIDYAAVPAAGFTAFAEPGFAKTVYLLEVRELGGGRSLLTGTMRTATTDEHARRWFRRYWTLGVGSGAHVLVTALLEEVRDDAEDRVEALTTA
jgi:hypothetical protein